MSDMTGNGMTKGGETRIETDSLGEVAVPAHVHWGAQTQRSIVNFPIGGEKNAPRTGAGAGHSEAVGGQGQHEAGRAG